MKISIVYYTKTNNTKKLADAIAKEFKVSSQNVCENPNIKSVDILFIGTAIYRGQIPEQITDFVSKLDLHNVKKVVFFINSGTGKGVDKLQSMKNDLTNKGISVGEEVCTCKGKFMIFNRKHPNSDDIKRLIDFAKRFCA